MCVHRIIVSRSFIYQELSSTTTTPNQLNPLLEKIKEEKRRRKYEKQGSTIQIFIKIIKNNEQYFCFNPGIHEFSIAPIL